MLERLATLILRAALSPQAIALHRLIVAESARFPELAAVLAREGATEEAITLIAGVLEREVKAARLKLDDPVFAAQQFLQMVIAAAAAPCHGPGPAHEQAGARRMATQGGGPVPERLQAEDISYDRGMNNRGSSRLQHVAHDAMRERGLLPDFSAAVMAETNALAHAATAADATARDLRGLLWASIDNDDSRDLDQLSVAGAAADGAERILVAVADVDALVKKGSNIDNHAAVNTTSVYTAAEIFPMLPEKLSTNLTSLNPDEDRLAVVVEMTVAAGGSVTAASIYRALVRNHAKLAYNGVAAWLEGDAAAPAALAAVPGVDEQLRRQSRVAQTLKRMRETRGALTLDTLEARPIFFDDTLADLAPDESNRAKELIEDFMVAANGIVARFLADEAMPSLRRVLRTPQRWDRIVSLAAQAGEKLPALPDAVALDAFLLKRRNADPDGFADLSLSIVKLLGSGEYALEVPGAPTPGHFALAVKDYTHSTAPEPPVSRSHHAAHRQGRARRATFALQQHRARDARRALHRAAEERGQGRTAGRQVRGRAAAVLTYRRDVQGHRDRRLGQGDLGAHLGTDDGRTCRQGLSRARRRRPRTVQLVHTDVDRGFIDFAAARGPS